MKKTIKSKKPIIKASDAPVTRGMFLSFAAEMRARLESLEKKMDQKNQIMSIPFKLQAEIEEEKAKERAMYDSLRVKIQELKQM